MKTDTYTKVVLTVIAVCLTFNVVKDLELVPTIQANTVDEEKSIANETIDVRIVDINTYDELNVNLKSVDTYDEVKVNIKNIDTDDELDVNIDEVGGSWVNNGSPIPVSIKN